MTPQTSIVLFCQDLRLQNNPALSSAVRRGGPVILVFIWATTDEGSWAPGAASRCWLHHSLLRLNAALQRYGSQLIIRQGASQASILALVRDTGADAIFWNRRHEPQAARVEQTLMTSRLSPHLHFGEISPSQLWHTINAHTAMHGQAGLFGAASAWLRSSIGGNSPRTCCGIFPIQPISRCARSSQDFPGEMTQRACAPGSVARPAIRSWMRGCVNYGRQAGCTTVCVWWWPLFW
jgi:DNA photolyase